MYKKFMSVFNPEITESSKDLCLAWEGCISNEDHIALVERPKRVKVKFWNIQGRECDMVCDGLVSRIFQHEIDHLDGRGMEQIAKELHKISDIENPEQYDLFY